MGYDFQPTGFLHLKRKTTKYFAKKVPQLRPKILKRVKISMTSISKNSLRHHAGI
jgi:hypothetical protein